MNLYLGCLRFFYRIYEKNEEEWKSFSPAHRFQDAKLIKESAGETRFIDTYFQNQSIISEAINEEEKDDEDMSLEIDEELEGVSKMREFQHTELDSYHEDDSNTGMMQMTLCMDGLVGHQFDEVDKEEDTSELLKTRLEDVFASDDLLGRYEEDTFQMISNMTNVIDDLMLVPKNKDMPEYRQKENTYKAGDMIETTVLKSCIIKPDHADYHNYMIEKAPIHIQEIHSINNNTLELEDVTECTPLKPTKIFKDTMKVPEMATELSKITTHSMLDTYTETKDQVENLAEVESNFEEFKNQSQMMNQSYIEENSENIDKNLTMSESSSFLPSQLALDKVLIQSETSEIKMSMTPTKDLLVNSSEDLELKVMQLSDIEIMVPVSPNSPVENQNELMDPTRRDPFTIDTPTICEDNNSMILSSNTQATDDSIIQSITVIPVESEKLKLAMDEEVQNLVEHVHTNGGMTMKEFLRFVDVRFLDTLMTTNRRETLGYLRNAGRFTKISDHYDF
jgi:hypothetical protein